MGRTSHWALVLGALLVAPAARALADVPGTGPGAGEPTPTECGGKPVGPGKELQPLGQGFLAEGERVRRGCTLLLQQPLKNRPPRPFAREGFQPLGCGFFRHGSGIYWDKALDAADVTEVEGTRAEVLSRLDLVDGASFEVGPDCQPRDARFFYLNHTARPAFPAFVAVPRGEGQGYEELGCGFVRTGGRVFFGTQLVEGAQAATFTSVQGRLPYAECGEGAYGKDRARVWWREQLVRGASAKLFRVPREDNPGARVACVGRRSFQGPSVDKQPDPVCRGVKKPAKPVKPVKKSRR